MKKTIIALVSVASFTFASVAMSEDGDADAGKLKFKSTCVPCHGTKAEGLVGPKLAGQPTTEIIRKLTEYRADKKRGPMTYMMAPMAKGLTEEEMKNVAAFVSGL